MVAESETFSIPQNWAKKMFGFLLLTISFGFLGLGLVERSDGFLGSVVQIGGAGKNN
jgi:hypothetical protein